MTGCFVVNPRGRAGGLALLWKEGVDVSISSYTTNHIDAHVGGEVQAFTAGENILLRSSHGDWWITWALSAFPLGSLLATSILPFTPQKKGRGQEFDFKVAQDFMEVLDRRNLRDLGFTRHPFTWSNRREEMNHIEE